MKVHDNREGSGLCRSDEVQKDGGWEGVGANCRGQSGGVRECGSDC